MPCCGFEIEKSWREALADELAQPYMHALEAFVARERAAHLPIYPPESLVFNALLQTPFDQVKVVIMGQDPYHGAGQAHGLSFSVPKGVPPPPSLQNIFKELQTDLGIPPPSHGCLLDWARQGVLLLNATLTVQEGLPKSHYGKGWERFTHALIERLVQRRQALVFLLWGKSAQEKFHAILPHCEQASHLVLTAAHPSPFSATGFFGCRHFSKTNDFLQKQGKTAIDWRLTDC